MFELIYCSIAIWKLSEQSIYEILQEARKFNSANGITGCLLYHNNEFIQILEGEEETVKKVFSKIEKDPRHQSVQVVFKGIKDNRLFEDWSMAFERPEAADEIIDGFMSIDKLGMRKVATNGSLGVDFSKNLFYHISKRLLKSKLS